MIRSMTGFGRARTEAEDMNITVEIKAVNSRYLDCTVKYPRVLAPFEERIKTLIQQSATSRGKVEVSILLERQSAEVGAVSVDMELTRGYLSALRKLSEELGITDDVTVSRLAANRDIFTYQRAEEDAEAIYARLLPVLTAASAEFLAARTAEGNRILADLEEKLAGIAARVDRIEALSAADKDGYKSKLEGRLRQLLGESGIVADEARLLTEVAVFADRIAIDEELVRLRSHFVAFRELVASREPAGRRLDFLMQEMNRETNTIGSKAQNSEIAHIVVDIKGELEKIREQVQNIE